MAPGVTVLQRERWWGFLTRLCGNSSLLAARKAFQNPNPLLFHMHQSALYRDPRSCRAVPTYATLAKSDAISLHPDLEIFVPTAVQPRGL